VQQQEQLRALEHAEAEAAGSRSNPGSGTMIRKGTPPPPAPPDDLYGYRNPGVSPSSSAAAIIAGDLGTPGDVPDVSSRDANEDFDDDGASPNGRPRSHQNEDADHAHGRGDPPARPVTALGHRNDSPASAYDDGVDDDDDDYDPDDANVNESGPGVAIDFAAFRRRAQERYAGEDRYRLKPVSKRQVREALRPNPADEAVAELQIQNEKSGSDSDLEYLNGGADPESNDNADDLVYYDTDQRSFTAHSSTLAAHPSDSSSLFLAPSMSGSTSADPIVIRFNAHASDEVLSCARPQGAALSLDNVQEDDGDLPDAVTDVMDMDPEYSSNAQSRHRMPDVAPLFALLEAKRSFMRSNGNGGVPSRAGRARADQSNLKTSVGSPSHEVVSLPISLMATPAPEVQSVPIERIASSSTVGNPLSRQASRAEASSKSRERSMDARTTDGLALSAISQSASSMSLSAVHQRGHSMDVEEVAAAAIDPAARG